MNIIEIRPKDSFIEEHELGPALITTDTNFSSAEPLRTKDGKLCYIPQFRNAQQNAGNEEAFTTVLDASGRLTLYLQSYAPVGTRAEAERYASSLSAQLTATPTSGSAITIALSVNSVEGDIWKLSAQLSASQQTIMRSVVAESNPNAQIIVTVTVLEAIQLTQDFVNDNWRNPEIKKALLNLFGGQITLESPGSFWGLATQAHPNINQTYLTAECTYEASVNVPPIPGFKQWTLTWNNRNYSYYQDNLNVKRFYYLPDKFQILKTENKPDISLLEFDIPNGDLTSAQATFRYFAQASTQAERVRNAAQKIQAKLGQMPDMTTFQGVPHVAAQLTLFLPTSDANASTPTQRTEASIDFSTGIRDEINLKFKAFQALWNAIFTDAQEQRIFTGYVDLDIDGRYKESIPFDGRLPAAEEKAYYYEILDAGIDTTYSRHVSALALNSVFEASGNSSQQAVIVQLIFSTEGSNNTITLKKSAMEGHVTIQRSLTNLLIEKEDAGIFKYLLKVTRANSRSCCPRESDSTDIIIIPADIHSCKDNC
ncbi:MAG: hypothetical protein HLUCCA11_21800 [Phormidesmis priestleyi Ana]|uniref:Uncharacterized protein n=1 Tax=Phormidesmis priestleyi Ana TaxID=1666911 RepID=A0A0P7ZHU4_9CYAN|nr:MAG: hypothetical protein HLUCCA11_21800 [Phormidesmis priestleyi Ana]